MQWCKGRVYLEIFDVTGTVATATGVGARVSVSFDATDGTHPAYFSCTEPHQEVRYIDLHPR